MCTFITGVLLRSADTPAFRDIVTSCGLAFEPLSNRHVQAQLEPNERYYRVTRDECDCGTSLGLTGDDLAGVEFDDSKSIAAMRKKGWSEAKIARLIQTAMDARERGADAERRRDEARPVPDSWVSFLERALELRQVPFVGIMMREYDGRLESARFTLAGRVAVDVAWLRNPSRRWVEGRLYEFRRSEHVL
jgi:hypothetical protein